MPITSKAEFKEYCLRALGKGATTIAVTDEQVDDRIEDAVQMWMQRHVDSTTETYVKHQLTQADLDNGYITLPDSISRVISVVDMMAAGSSNSIFGLQYQMYMRDIFSMYELNNMGGVQQYVQSMQYISMIRDMLNNVPNMPVSVHEKKLFINSDTHLFSKDKYLVLHVHLETDPELIVEAYNDIWLKRYATALIKKQWGENLSKYNGVAMLGGVTFNGPDIRADAVTEIDKLEEQLRNDYEAPPDMIWG